jgi:hypothetical protein
MGSMRIRTILLALVAAFAMSAVASATASAALSLLPQLVNKEGKELVTKLFKGKSGASTFETKSGESVKCTADAITGQITGLSTDTAEIDFTGCSAASGLLKCKSKGAATAGLILLNVNSLLVWLNDTGLAGEDDILPTDLTIECSGLASETLLVKGSTLCPTTTALSKKATITCKQTKGVQEYTEYLMLEGPKVKDITETEGKGTKVFAFEQSGLTGTDEIEFDEEVLIIT